MDKQYDVVVVGAGNGGLSAAAYLAKAGKKNGCLIEGMACPGGCIAGAGTNIAIPQAMKEVAGFKALADKKIPDREDR